MSRTGTGTDHDISALLMVIKRDASIEITHIGIADHGAYKNTSPSSKSSKQTN
jgi:hypothetical protein